MWKQFGYNRFNSNRIQLSLPFSPLSYDPKHIATDLSQTPMLLPCIGDLH